MSKAKQLPEGNDGSQGRNKRNKTAGYSGSSYFSTHRLKSTLVGRKYPVPVDDKCGLELLAEILKRNGLIPLKGYKDIYHLIEKIEEVMEPDIALWERKHFFIQTDGALIQLYPLNIAINNFALYLEDFYKLPKGPERSVIACGLGKMSFQMGFPFITDDLESITEDGNYEESYGDEEEQQRVNEERETRKKEVAILEEIKREILDAYHQDFKRLVEVCTMKKRFKSFDYELRRWINAIEDCLEMELDFRELYPDYHSMEDESCTNMLALTISLNRDGPLEDEQRITMESEHGNYTVIEPCYIVTHDHTGQTGNMTMKQSYEINPILNVLFGLDISKLKEQMEKENSA